jgi:pilus assembly protein Flp/PilA
MGLFKMAQLATTWVAARLNIKSERGATAVEYGLMVALIAAVIIVGVVLLGQKTSETFCQTSNSISDKAASASKACP